MKSNTKITITIVVVILILFLVIGYMSSDKNNKVSELLKGKPVVQTTNTAKTYFYEKEGKYYAKFVGGGYDDRVIEVTPDFYGRMISMFPRGGANGHVPTEAADIIG